MKKVLLSLASAAIALCSAAQTYHAITDGESVSCTEENIAATDWITYSKTNYSSRSKCVTTGENIPNLSSSDRIVSFYVSGCASFEVTADGNGSRSLLIGVNGETTTQVWGNNCNTYTFDTNNTGDIVITVAGSDGSVYLSSLTLYAPQKPIVQSFTVGGEEMTIDNTAYTITGTVSANVDLSTTKPVVTVAGTETGYRWDGSYTNGTLQLLQYDTEVVATYTVNVTNRALDNTPPQPTGWYSGDLALHSGDYCPVDGTIRIEFDENIKLVDAENVALYGVQIGDDDGETFCQQDIANCWAEENKLYIQPQPRLNSGFSYIVGINNTISDMENNLYDAGGIGMISFATETATLSVTDNTPESDQYIHALKLTFSGPIELVDASQIMINTMYYDSEYGMPMMDQIYAENVEVAGNNLYILDVADMPNSTIMYGVGINCVKSPYYDQLVADEDYEDFCYVSDGDDQMGSNDFFVGFNAPINDTYIMPAWITGTEGISVKRDYAGTDMPAGKIGAIRGNATDQLILEIPQICDVEFTVSATGGRTFTVTNDNNETLATLIYTKNQLATLTATVETPGKIYLSTPSATGGFTVQGISTAVPTGVKNLAADKKADIRYANNVIINNGVTVEVYNTLGVCVARSNSNIDMTAMPKGVYIVRTENSSMKIAR